MREVSEVFEVAAVATIKHHAVIVDRLLKLVDHL